MDNYWASYGNKNLILWVFRLISGSKNVLNDEEVGLDYVYLRHLHLILILSQVGIHQTYGDGDKAHHLSGKTWLAGNRRHKCRSSLAFGENQRQFATVCGLLWLREQNHHPFVRRKPEQSQGIIPEGAKDESKKETGKFYRLQSTLSIRKPSNEPREAIAKACTRLHWGTKRAVL